MDTDPMNEANVGKVFRFLDDGNVEKCFVDHSANPPRSYRTGEIYRPLTKDDDEPGDDEEDVVVYRPEDFSPCRYRRVTSTEGCIFREEEVA
jgi:hypothetical protein